MNMKLGLLQTKHNHLYNFLSSQFPYSREQCLALQNEQVHRNLEMLNAARDLHCDLLVTTECINYIRTAPQSSPDDRLLYPPLDCRWVEELSVAAKQANSWLVAGFGFQEEGIAKNGALLFDRSGVLVNVYRKIHLAESEKNVFLPGKSFCVHTTDFGVLGLCICWDMQFPETARILALNGASLLVCPTWGWEANLYGRARAYENGIFVAAAMAVPAWGAISSPRTPSSIVSPDGSLISCGSVDRAELVIGELDLDKASFSHIMRLKGRRPELYHPIVQTI